MKIPLGRHRLCRRTVSEVVRVWSGFIWLRSGPVDGSCEYGSEAQDSMECGRLLWLTERLFSCDEVLCSVQCSFLCLEHTVIRPIHNANGYDNKSTFNYSNINLIDIVSKPQFPSSFRKRQAVNEKK